MKYLLIGEELGVGESVGLNIKLIIVSGVIRRGIVISIKCIIDQRIIHSCVVIA